MASGAPLAATTQSPPRRRARRATSPAAAATSGYSRSERQSACRCSVPASAPLAERRAGRGPSGRTGRAGRPAPRTPAARGTASGSGAPALPSTSLRLLGVDQAAHRHAVLGQRAGLVDAQHGGRAQRLDGRRRARQHLDARDAARRPAPGRRSAPPGTPRAASPSPARCRPARPAASRRAAARSHEHQHALTTSADRSAETPHQARGLRAAAASAPASMPASDAPMRPICGVARRWRRTSAMPVAARRPACPRTRTGGSSPPGRPLRSPAARGGLAHRHRFAGQQRLVDRQARRLAQRRASAATRSPSASRTESPRTSSRPAMRRTLRRRGCTSARGRGQLAQRLQRTLAAALLEDHEIDR